jgi:hypothetical protein
MSRSSRPRSFAPAAALVACVLAVCAPASAGTDFRISAGQSSSDLLASTVGLDLRAGTLHAAWADNSAELGGNPDRPALDVGAAAVALGPGGATVGPRVNVTHAPASQFGVSLAVDPTDPSRLVLAALDGSDTSSAMRAFSRDGGATWTTVAGLPGNFGGFPPKVACDMFGNCFLLLVDDPSFGNPHLDLLLSTDGGATFAALALPDPPGLETGASLAVGGGSVWIVYQGGQTGFALQAFSAPVNGKGSVGPFALQTLPGTGDGRNADVAVGPNGQVLVAYEHGIFSQTPSVSAQLDPDGLGPAGFGARVTVANVPGYPFQPRTQVGYAPSGRAVVVYRDRPEPAGPDEVLLQFSDDDGASWSPEIGVSDPVVSARREFPNVAVDPAGGTVGVAWYDFRSGGAELFGDVLPTLTAPANPRSPVDLAATAVSRSQIDLRWSDVSGNETGFQIQRSTGNPFEAPVIVATVGPNVTSYSDTGLPEDSGFGYRVRAVNGAGASHWSNGASATTLDTAPSAPANLVATAITFQRIDLRWSASDDADNYEVEQSTNGVDFVQISRPNVTEMMIFGLQSQTTYFFRVRAVNSGGPSPYSNVASATTLGENQPAAPTELRATTLSGSKILLQWRDNSVNETRFEIERSTGGGPFQRAGTAQANSQSVTQSFTDTGLKRSTTYVYRVRACNSSACSPSSNTASATTGGR